MWERRISPRMMRRMMESLKMKFEEVPDVQQVIIITSSKKIMIKEPKVNIFEVRGERFFQVSGKMEEHPLEKPLEIPEEDVQLVAQQAGVDEASAREALVQTRGDIAMAILLLKEKKALNLP